MTAPLADEPRYVLYARKSSEGEDRQVQSIDDQLRVLRQLAQQRGLTVAHELTETKSAKAEGLRPVFARMIALLKAGEADAVLCWHINRLSRNPEDSGRLAGMLQRGEVRVIQTPEKCYRPEDNALILAVDTGMANQDIRDLRRNSRRGMDTKVEKGWFPHKAPPGYLNDVLKRQGERTISPDPDRFPLVKRALEMLLAGDHPVDRVRAILNEQWGFRTRPHGRSAGGPLPRTTFYRMVGSLFYAGYFLEDGVIHKGAHEPMITLEQFQRLQEIVKAERPAKRSKHAFPYRGLIRCAHCGGWVTAELKRKPSGRTYRYYHCGGGGERRACKRYRVREEALEEALLGQLASITIEDDVAQLLVAANDEWRGRALAERRERGEADRRALAEADRRLGALLDLRLEGLLTTEEYAAKKRSLLTERDALAGRLSGASEPCAGDQEAVMGTVEFHRRAGALFASGDAELRRAIARILGASYTLEFGHLRVELSPVLRPVPENAEALHAQAQKAQAASAVMREAVPLGEADREVDAEDRPPGMARPLGKAVRARRPNRTLGRGSGSTKEGTFVPHVLFGVPGGPDFATVFPVLDAIADAAQEHDLHLPRLT